MFHDIFTFNPLLLADLQKNILARYAELGITPVMPAFNGVVPEEMAKLFPTANITR
jgi:hypothetical protein